MRLSVTADPFGFDQNIFDEIGHDMEQVVNDFRPGEILPDHPRVGGVHVAGDGLDLPDGLVLAEKLEERLDGPAAFALSDPEESAAFQIHHDSRIAVPFVEGEFVNGQILHPGKIDMAVKMIKKELITDADSVPRQPKVTGHVPD